VSSKTVYGLSWSEQTDPLEIEFAMIRAGGYVVDEGLRRGKGLFYHTRQAFSYLWPSHDHNRWSDLCLRNICEERITVMQGTKDSGKTCVMSKFGLMDYWSSPDDTLTLVSSTGMRELKLRIWGEMSSLFKSAKERYPWLAGKMSNTQMGIFTDLLEDSGDVRDIRRGIIAVPCIGGEGEWIGLERYVGIKQKRRRILGDECFPAGTMVDTPTGPVPIESIDPGDRVFNAIGVAKVVAAKSRLVDTGCEILLGSGRFITCTKHHKFFTQFGWVKACHLNAQHFIFATHEAMRLVQTAVPAETQRTNFLQSSLRAELDPSVSIQACQALGTPSGLVEFSEGCKAQAENLGTYEEKSTNARSENLSKGRSGDSCGGMQAAGSGGQRHGSDKGRVAAYANVPRGHLELRDQDREMEWKWHSTDLQSRFRLPKNPAGYRGRWRDSQLPFQTGEGSKEREFFEGDWVEGVKILKPGDPRFPLSGPNHRRCRVFNLQVEGHPSYSVEGLLVHNCQFMHAMYVNVLDALDKGDFKGVFSGNPIGGNGKALDKIAEPEGGWTSLGEITKTTTWRNKYGGITVQLVGNDSPNFDANRPKDYPYLTNAADLKKIEQRNGKDSAQYWTLGLGVRKVGIDLYRVLTEEMCKKHGAFNSVIWSGMVAKTRVYAIDAGFGGDPCEVIDVVFAEDVNGIFIIEFSPTRTIPISVSSSVTPEDQIANYVKEDAARLNIPDSHIYFDAGMRATLAISMARILSASVNAVNFGGPATDRPVTNDTFVDDPKTGAKRLIMCSEWYSKFVTELWYSVRQLVECGQARSLPLDVAKEFSLREWRWVPGPLGQRYELETKPEFKSRNMYSPNKADVASIAVEGCRRLGFVIEKSKPVTGDEREDWLSDAFEKHRQVIRKSELKYN